MLNLQNSRNCYGEVLTGSVDLKTDAGTMAEPVTDCC